MLESGRISTRQFSLMLFCILSSAIFYSLPKLVIQATGEDAWQAIVIAWALDAALAVVFYVLGLRYPRKTMVEYSAIIMGRWLGKPIGFIFVLFYVLASALLLQMLTNFLTTALMPETPPVVFILVILGVSWYGVNAGLEVIGRIAEIIAPLMIGAILLIIISNTKDIKLGKMLPVFQHSVGELLKPSLLVGILFGFCISMGMYQAYHNKPEETLKAKLIAVTLGSFLFILIAIELISVSGINLTVTQVYPIYRLVQMIRLGDFLERFEIAMVMFWVAGTFVAITALQYNAALGMAQVFNAKKYQKLIPYVSFMIGLYALVGQSSSIKRFAFVQGPFFYFALFVEDFLMILLLCVSLLRHGKKTTQARR